MPTRKQIVDEALTYLGDPAKGIPPVIFHHQGRSRQGVDCIGYVHGVAVATRCDLRGYVDDPTYGRDPDKRMEDNIEGHVKRLVPRPPLLPGMLIMFAFGTKAQHLGIVTREDFFVHAYEKMGRVVENRLDRYWLSLIRGVFDFYGVSD